MICASLTRVVPPLVGFPQLPLEKNVVLDLCSRLRRRGSCLRGPNDGLVRRFDGRRIPVIGSFLASLRGDKSRLDLVSLGVCCDEIGSGYIAFEGV